MGERYSQLGLAQEKGGQRDIALWLSALGCSKDHPTILRPREHGLRDLASGIQGLMPEFAMDGGSSGFSDLERNHPDVGKTIELEDTYVLIVNPLCLAHEAFTSS